MLPIIFDVKRCEFLVELTVQNSRLLFLTENYLKSFFSYCEKLGQWNKETVVEYYLLVLYNNYEIRNYVMTL